MCGRKKQTTNQCPQGLSCASIACLVNLSHEMKVPLTVISNYAGLTISQLDKNAVDEQTVHNLDRIQQEAVRLGRLVDEMLERSLEKKRQYALVDTDANTLLCRAARDCRTLCRGRHNQILVACRPALIPIRIHADALHQVLLNLLTNANRQMYGGVITLSADYDGRGTHVLFQVADGGYGIPPERIERVFDRGVSGTGGTGLGLAICKQLLQEQGGSIAIESDGNGTAVQFTLPCVGGGEQS